MKGTLSVNAKPWARVYIGGKDYGRTPQTIKALDLGTHKVRLENPDFTSWETIVEVSQKGTHSVYHEFSNLGSVAINSKPWANVYLDGNLKGQTPTRIEGVSAGEHQVKIVRDGYAEITRTITVKGSEETSLRNIPLRKNEN